MPVSRQAVCLCVEFCAVLSRLGVKAGGIGGLMRHRQDMVYGQWTIDYTDYCL